MIFGKKSFWFCGLMLWGICALTACGKGATVEQEEPEGTSSEVPVVQEREWVFVPEAVEVGGRAEYGHMRPVGDEFCYIERNQETEESVSYLCRYSLADKEVTRFPVDWQEGSENYWEIGPYFFDRDKNAWLIANVYSADFSGLQRFVCKFDTAGKCTASWEITEQAGRGIAIDDLYVDGQGRRYIFTPEKGILLYDSDGNYHDAVSCVSTENSEGVWLKGVDIGADGKVYVCISGDSQGNCTLAEVDFEGSRLVELIGGCPDILGFCVADGPSGSWAEQYDFILYDATAAYGYTLSGMENGSGGAGEELLVWMDSDVNGYFVPTVGVLEDGRLYATVEDWMNEDCILMLLTRTRAEQVPKREEMVLATVNGGGDLNALAVRFSRGNAKYHLTVDNYDSLGDLYNAMLTGEAMDIIDLSGVNVQKMDAQGIFEDLAPYVERTDAFGRSDFVDGILDVYTFGDRLVSIPTTFTLRTVMGDSSRLENKAGLSLEELLKITDRDPGTRAFDGITKGELMSYIMMFNEEEFVDWDTGKCHFDSEVFQAVLELAGRYPDAVETREGEVSLPTKIQNGEVLFAIADIYGIGNFQLYQGIFGENAASVGFPTADGKGGTLLFTDTAFAIASGSEHKDGAWDFIEGVVLAQERERYFYFHHGCFPTLKRILEEQIETRIAEDREWAEQGNRFGGGRVYDDGWTYEGHALTREEVNVILSLFPEAKPACRLEDDEILRIINEEAPAYYSGQKSAKDVAGIIQNRVRLYVNENL